MIRAVLFDFGGVIAEEGFVQGLRAIAQANRLDPGAFFRAAEGLIHESGYVTGKTSEAAYWAALRKRTGIAGPDASLREEILSRFVLRSAVLDQVDLLRSRGLSACILSDQTDWLDELDRRTPFFHHFDRIYNSFHLHKSKRDRTLFSDVCTDLSLQPADVLFTDDNAGNISRAEQAGLRTIHFTGCAAFEERLKYFGL